MSRPTDEYLHRAFLHFSEMCDGASPLYAMLSARVADAPMVRRLAAHGQPRQPPVNLLFGAVHFLLLGGVEHALASFYPSVDGRADPTQAWGPFESFCSRYDAQIIEQVAMRRVQTNEVGRCGLLMPAFARAHGALRRPLHLVEVGASAGLNLYFDRYRYDYGNQRTYGAGSDVMIRTELRGAGHVVLPSEIPEVAARCGIDMAPVDVTSADAMRWVEALIWPDQLDRVELHRAARAQVELDPPRMIEGDGLALVPGEIEAVAPDAIPCVYHSHATCQMAPEWRDAFADRLDSIGRGRDLAYVSLEWLGDDPGPQLRVTTWSNGASTTVHLADCHHHGRWMRVSGHAKPTV